MADLRWGVRCEGSFVTEVADGLSAFRVEGELRGRGDESAQACFTTGGGTWMLIGFASSARPDPRVPVRVPRPVRWWALRRPVVFRACGGRRRA
jgi:hypothetical protein